MGFSIGAGLFITHLVLQLQPLFPPTILFTMANDDLVQKILAIIQAHPKEVGGLLVVFSSVIFYLLNRGKYRTTLYTSSVPSRATAPF